MSAIYWFARTADDIADEGAAEPGQRLADLAAYRSELLHTADGTPGLNRWPGVFIPLGRALRDFALPLAPLQDLLSAFEQDVAKTRDHAGYHDRAELLDYCRRSANPIGRLLLHLYGVHDAAALVRSDCICTALQLINFWQDLGQDLARGRRYLPDADCREHGVDPASPASSTAERRRSLVQHECAWARSLMLQGSPLVHQVAGRAGWELRAVVQGGLRILDKIEALGFDTFSSRPKLGALDVAPVTWRSVRM